MTRPDITQTQTGLPPAELVITIHGAAAPQGSKNRGRYSLYDTNAKTLKPWREAVRSAAEKAVAGQPGYPYGPTVPMSVQATITLPRPKYHYGTGRNALTLRAGAPAWPIARGKGDSDKFLRALLDSCTGVIFTDDVQVVEATVTKVYPHASVDALDRPGALIRISPLVERTSA